jgi:hypothetical protein
MQETAMRIDHLESSDRKKIRRILIQIVSLYVLLIVIVIGGVMATSAFIGWSDTSLSQKVDLR